MTDAESQASVEEKPTDLSESDVVTKYKLAAEIANKTLTGLLGFCKAGTKVTSACKFGDTLITKQCESVYKSKKIEKGIAFPTCISRNEVVCHYSPLESESETLAAGDVVKIDLGVQVDGYISVLAHTFIVGAGDEPVKGSKADVFTAAYTALDACCKMIKPGTKNSEVTEMIKNICEDYGVKPVQGVLMHQLKRFVIDANQVVIQREEAEQKVDSFEFEAYQVYTVDIVLTTNTAEAAKPSQSDYRTTVFKRAVDQSYQLKLKASRQVYNSILTNFSALPFSLRNILDTSNGEASEGSVRMGIVECIKHGLVHAYPVLTEKKGETVVHLKTTLLVTPNMTTAATTSETAKSVGVTTGAPLHEAITLKGFETEKNPRDEVLAVLKKSMGSKKKKKSTKKKDAEGE